MDTERLIIHRANATVSRYPIETLALIIEAGYDKLEFDITVTGRQSFKFCHPTNVQFDFAIYRFDSQLFKRLAQFKVSLWVVDVKYPYGDPPPVELLENIHAAFGDRVVIDAAQPDLLTAAHERGIRTGQIFRTHIPPELPFQPDFLLYDEGEENEALLYRTIVYCQSLESGKKYLDKGAPYILLDLPVVEAGMN